MLGRNKRSHGGGYDAAHENEGDAAQEGVHALDQMNEMNMTWSVTVNDVWGEQMVLRAIGMCVSREEIHC